MHLASTPGKTVVCMKASTKKTKSMDMAFTLGLTKRSTQDGGATGSSTGSESLFLKKAGRS